MFPRNFGIVRKLLLAALVGGSSVAVPVAARAEPISGELALLGKAETAPGTASVESTRTDFSRVENAVSDGERALLEKSRKAVISESGTATDSGSHASSVDGARALLGDRKI